jgi:hypothetical protein
VLGIFIFILKGHHLGLPPVKPKILKFYAKIRRYCKSQAAPFILLFHNINTNLNGATQSLAQYKWCYENKK